MNKNLKTALIMITILVVISSAAVFLAGREQNPESYIKGQTYDRVSYDTFGTAASSTGVTYQYSDNQKVFISGGLENIHLDISYTPSSTNSVLSILIEGSNDDGVTYFPLATKSVGTTDVKMYSEGVTSTYSGIPITFPGDSTSVAGTELKGMVDFDMVADHVRVSILESTTANEGLVYIRTTLTSKK